MDLSSKRQEMRRINRIVEGCCGAGFEPSYMDDPARNMEYRRLSELDRPVMIDLLSAVGFDHMTRSEDRQYILDLWGEKGHPKWRLE